jgi:hypothetical protein
VRGSVKWSAFRAGSQRIRLGGDMPTNRAAWSPSRGPLEVKTTRACVDIVTTRQARDTATVSQACERITRQRRALCVLRKVCLPPPSSRNHQPVSGVQCIRCARCGVSRCVWSVYGGPPPRRNAARTASMRGTAFPRGAPGGTNRFVYCSPAYSALLTDDDELQPRTAWTFRRPRVNMWQSASPIAAATVEPSVDGAEN